MVSNLDKNLHLLFPDGTIYRLPVLIVALNRAENYKGEFEGSRGKSFSEDTEPLFAECVEEIYDWLFGNMDWVDVKDYAVKVQDPTPLNLEEHWMSCRASIAEEL